MPLDLNLEREYLQGDAWSRFYLRFLEVKNSITWLEKILPELDITKIGKGPLYLQKIKKFKPGLYFQSVEGWRGSVLVALELNAKCLQYY